MNTGIFHLEWLSAILETDLPSPAKMLALYISTYMNKERINAWPSLSTTSKHTGLSLRTVMRHFKLLEQLGWINRKKGNSYQTTKYQIQYPNSKIINITDRLPRDIQTLGKVTQTLGRVREELEQGQNDPRVGSERPTNQQYNQQKNQQLLLEEKNTLPKEKNIISNITSKSKNNITPDITSKKRKSTKFKKPTIEEISTYCHERHNEINPEQFFDFYETKGWMVGKSPMKNWQAAVRTWERNQTPKTEVDLFAEYR